MSQDANRRSVARVLAGDDSFDDLDAAEQALVREIWVARIAARREALNYEAEFEAAGEPYSEAVEHGDVIVHRPAR